MRTIVGPVAAVAAVLSMAAIPLHSADLIVHEWGTFTSFQDARGQTIPGINVDDEPVPKFVHRLNDIQVFTPRSIPARWSQGAPRCHPDVTLRLETPVLYFYPQPGFAARSIDVRAAFVGGWLTEFYPFAETDQAGFPATLDRSARGSLNWQGLKLASGPASLPQTTEHVWLAPRAVASAIVTNARQTESEKYLFYRGVGHLDAPLMVREKQGSLGISLREGSGLEEMPSLWIVRVQPDRRVRYRRVSAGERSEVNTPLPAADSKSPSELDALRGELADALLAEGLYADEARAMLATWRLSYFESEGVRVFFVLPRPWTDTQLPLSISVPADITRVMLGRIELASPHQMTALRKLQELPATAFDLQPILASGNTTVIQRISDGTASEAEAYQIAGRPVPEALRLYESMGRFRDALLVHEWNAARDDAQRKRLELIMEMFSACVADLSPRIAPDG
jgi:hypothetical protein